MTFVSQDPPGRQEEVAMAGLSRDAILTRYRHLRAISMRHHNGALEFLSKSALMEHARHLGLTAGKTLVAESMDELTLAIDLAVYTAKPGHSRLIVQDLLRQGEAWLVDEALEQSAPEGMSLAMRLGTPDVFTVTSGIIVPVDREVMTEVLDEVLPRVRGTPEQVANDRRFATAIYRAAVA
jgi:hypothetical protein